jgi:hypothetical protein
MDHPIIRTSAAVAAGLLAVALAVPVEATSSVSPERAGNFKIDKIHYKQGATLNSEYIVIKNISAKKRALTHFRVVDPNDGQRYTFPVTKLTPGHTVTLHTGHGHNRPGHRYWNRDAPVWNNDGDTAWLVNPQGVKIDTCKYAGGDTTANC